jgi:hypothetical protein
MRRVRHAVPALDRTAPVLAVALAALLLAGCTAGGPGSGGSAGKPGTGSASPGSGGKAGFAPAGRAGLNKVVAGGGPVHAFVVGPAGAGGAVISLPAGGPAVSSGRPHISVPAIPAASSAETVALPLDSYEEVSVQEQVAAAGDLLTQRCMAAAGFSYPVAAEPGGGAANVQSIEDGGYGVASLVQAETYGYKQSSPGGPLGSLAALPAFVGEQSKHGPAWTSALLGFVPGARAGAPQSEGCLQAADTELYGKLGGNPDPDPVPGIAVQAAQWTQSDPRILAVERTWSACMSRSGQAYKTPADAAERSWPSTPAPAEIAAAVADVRCKTQTNLVNTWLTVEAAYQQALISQNLTALSQLQATFGALQRRAEQLLQLPAATGILRISQGRVSGGRFGRGQVIIRLP